MFCNEKALSANFDHVTEKYLNSQTNIKCSMHEKCLIKFPMQLKVTCTQTITKNNENDACRKVVTLRCPHIIDSIISSNYCAT